MCRWVFLAAVAGALASVDGAGASPSLPPLPARWPHTLQLGMTDQPGGAAALRKVAPFGFRYQYLAGGVNTGQAWSTWNPNGSFVTRYDEESWAAGEIRSSPTTCCCSRSRRAATRRRSTSRTCATGG